MFVFKEIFCKAFMLTCVILAENRRHNDHRSIFTTNKPIIIQKPYQQEDQRNRPEEIMLLMYIKAMTFCIS